MRETANAAGLNFGLAVNSFQIRDAGAAFAVAAKTRFNMAVCEKEMRFESTENPTGTFRYAGGDAVSDFAAESGMKMRGHGLITFSASRPSTGVEATRDNLLTLMRNHIEAVGGHFKTKVLEWDVLDNAASAGENYFAKVIGEDYTDSAMAMARRVIGSDGFLYYNESGADEINEKSNALFAMAKRWLADKVPLDGFGLECHLKSGFDKEAVSANIQRFGDLGLRISLTQVDIKDGTPQDWANLMTACLENFNCVSFVTWGLTDRYSWLGDGCGCLLFSGDPPIAKEPAIQALLQALAKADPKVAARRKAFAAIPPGSLGPQATASLPVITLYRAAALTGDRRLGIVPLANGVAADILGRFRSRDESQGLSCLKSRAR